MRQFCQYICTGRHSLTRFDKYTTCNWQLHFCLPGQPEIGASLPLAYALPVAQECVWRQTKAITAKLQDDIIVLVTAYPQPICIVAGLPFQRLSTQIHDFALDRTTRRIGPHAVDANDYPVRFTVDDTFVGHSDIDNHTVGRADNTKRYRGYFSLGIAKDEKQVNEQRGRQNCVQSTPVLQDHTDKYHHCQQKKIPLSCDEWIAPSFQFIASLSSQNVFGLECARPSHLVSIYMRFTEFGLTTLKEIPAEAEIVSHQLMLRAGLIRRLASGLFTWMPLGFRVMKKVEQVVRHEMNKAGALEMVMPAVQPAELWQESGRWDVYGPLLLRMQDRHKREYCFGPTHEEVITDLARRELRSYKQLPVNFYQIQTKFRDEIRPRFGVMRAREFIMKDAYTFDIDQASLEKAYQKMHAAYSAIFEGLGLKFRIVDADSGEIGGSRSQEFHVLADSGEDAIAYCDADGYASNVETAATFPREDDAPPAAQELQKVTTPKIKTIEELSQYLNVAPERTLKVLIVDGDEGPVALALRGDHELNAIKAQRLPGVASPIQMSDAGTIRKATGCDTGFAGPIGLEIPIYFDHAVRQISDFVCGANETDMHYTGANFGRDIDLPETVDLRNVVEGDPTPGGKGTLSIARGIEVGHIFQLGTKYSEAMGATVQDENGSDTPLAMGSYGIGVTRIVAAAIEQNHDDNGIIWPEQLAPFDVVLVPINMQRSEPLREAAEQLYSELQDMGLDVLFDDRDARPGVKFADAELLGIPHRIVISERGLASNELEYRHRRDSESQMLKRDAALDLLRASSIS